MTTGPETTGPETSGPEETGSDEAAEAPTLDGYGNDTGFAEEAAEGEDPEQPTG